MRIAVVHNLPSGGALRAAGAQVAGLARRHAVDVFTLSTSETELVELRGADHRVYAFAPSPYLGRPFGMFDPLVRIADLARLDRVYRALAADVDRGGYDAVLVHPCRFTQAPLALAHLARPALYWCHEAPRALYEAAPAAPASTLAERVRELRHRPLAWALRRRLLALDRRAVRAARALAVNSRFTQERVRAIYARDAAVNYLGVDTARFAPGGPRGAHVLSVGALAPLKGFDLVIDALALIPAARRPPLILVADREAGDTRAELEARARAAGVALAIELRVPDARLVELYRSALATVYAPVREPFGLAPLESMACGTPVVGVREGGVLETVEPDVTGLLADRTAPALAAALDLLLADPARREALGARARERVMERWTWDASLSALEAMLSALR